ncbi:hypothetical protein WCLP8_2240002 [uncultured Gammaproteobacteria bacterium]
MAPGVQSAGSQGGEIADKGKDIKVMTVEEIDRAIAALAAMQADQAVTTIDNANQLIDNT